MKQNKIHIIWGIAVVVALIGGFFWGKSMAASTAGIRGSGRFAFGSSTTGFAGRGGGAGGGFTVGQVTEIDGNSLTLQLANGNSENVFYSSSTQVVIPETTSISNVRTGTMVLVSGTQNSDGSMTASMIQVRNALTTGGQQ